MKKFLFTLFFISICIASTLKFGNSDIFHNDILNNKYNLLTSMIINKVETESNIQIPDYVDTNHIMFMYNTAIYLDLPIKIVFRVIHKESTFRENAVSSAGAKGYMGIMPKTYKMYTKSLGLDSLDIVHYQKNVLIGMNLINDLYDYWNKKGFSTEKTWELTLASYNAGIYWVLFYKGIPPFTETKKYVKFILEKA